MGDDNTNKPVDPATGMMPQTPPAVANTSPLNPAADQGGVPAAPQQTPPMGGTPVEPVVGQPMGTAPAPQTEAMPEMTPGSSELPQQPADPMAPMPQPTAPAVDQTVPGTPQQTEEEKPV